MKFVTLSQAALDSIDAQIDVLKEQRNKIVSQTKDRETFILSEMKKSHFIVHGLSVRVMPTQALQATLPDCGLQNHFHIPLADGFGLHISDYGVMIDGGEREDVVGRLKWLVSLGVIYSSVKVEDKGYGTVAYVEFEMKRAIKERDNTLKMIEEVFK